MNKAFILFLLLLCQSIASSAQTAADTTVYDYVENMPYPFFPQCDAANHPGWTMDSTRACSELRLMAILSQNIRYPKDAREMNIEGLVVLSGIVETNGKITQVKPVKDIGHGCGPEAARVLKALNDSGLLWFPGKKDGKAVRVKINLPVRFKIEEIVQLPYIIKENGDTLYVETTTAPTFKKGNEALQPFILNNIRYPAAYLDSCKSGVLEMSLSVDVNGDVEIDNTLDFNGLGMDFQFEAIRFANRMQGMWEPALYGDKKVMAAVPLRVLFKSTQSTCAKANERFDQSILLGDEGAQFVEKGENEKAIEKLTQALALSPNNAEFLYLRASAYLTLNKKEEACADLGQAKKILGVTWFETLGKFICGW